jgi:hypothetical protein
MSLGHTRKKRAIRIFSSFRHINLASVCVHKIVEFCERNPLRNDEVKTIRAQLVSAKGIEGL